MRATIIVDDNIVYVDGKPRTVDCSQLAKDGIHAVQWYETFGEEEFRNEIDMASKMLTRKPNNLIDDLSPYDSYIKAWQIENTKQELIEAAERQRVEEEQRAIKAELERVAIAFEEHRIAFEEQKKLEAPQ